MPLKRAIGRTIKTMRRDWSRMIWVSWMLVAGCGGTGGAPTGGADGMGGSAGAGGTGGDPGTGASGGMGGIPTPGDLEPELLAAKDVLDVWGLSRNDLFITGEDGLVAHYDGRSWRPFDVRQDGARSDLEAVFGFASDDVFVVGERGIVLRFDGRTWTRQEDDDIDNNRLQDVWGSRPNDVYAVGSFGTVLNFDGSDWRSVDTGISFFGEWRGIHGTSDSDILIVGTRTPAGAPATPRAAHFNGASWSDLTIPDKSASGPRLNTVWALSPTRALAGGSPGWMLEWNGSTLVEIPSGTNEAINSIWGIASQAFATAVRNTVLAYNDVGWAPITGVPITDDNDPIGSVFGFAGNDVVAVRAGVFRYDGMVWSEMLPGIDQLFNFWAGSSDNALILGSRVLRVTAQGVAEEDFGGLSVPTLSAAWGPEDNIVAVGSDGSAFRFNGAGWGAMSTNNGESLNDVWGASKDSVFAVGANGTILNFNGAAWGAMASGTATTLRAVWGRSADEVYAVGDDGTILRYDGANWGPMASGVTERLYDVIGLGNGDVWVAYRGGLLVWDGVTWTPSPIEYEGTPRGVLRIDAADDENIYMTLFGADLAGVLVHFDGEEFTELPVVSGASQLLAVGALDVLAGDVGRVYRFQVP